MLVSVHATLGSGMKARKVKRTVSKMEMYVNGRTGPASTNQSVFLLRDNSNGSKFDAV